MLPHFQEFLPHLLTSAPTGISRGSLLGSFAVFIPILMDYFGIQLDKRPQNEIRVWEAMCKLFILFIFCVEKRNREIFVQDYKIWGIAHFLFCKMDQHYQ